MERRAILCFFLVMLFLLPLFSIRSFSGAAESCHGPAVSRTQPATMDIVDSWPMFHHDLSHSGYSASTGPNTNQTLWAYATGSSVQSSPSVANGVVYVGSDDDNVYALNATTGAKIWNYTTGYFVFSSPALANGIVYVGSADHNVYALNATTGTQVWNYTTGDYVNSSPAVADGTVYVGSYDYNLYALNATTGTQIWNYTTESQVVSSPAVSDGIVYVGSADHNVYALNATTGMQVWNYTTGDIVWSSPAVANGVVYVGSDDDNVYALNATTGTQIWNYTTGYFVSSAPRASPAVANGIVYVGSNGGSLPPFGGTLYALNATTGAPVWNYTTGDTVYSSPAVANGVVYVGSFDSNVYALNAATGSLIWTYTTGVSVVSSPAVADGIVYVGSNGGGVLAFGVHDVAVTNVVPSKTIIGKGGDLSITVTAANLGGYTETFNVTVYVNATSVASQNVTLSSANSADITFGWDTKAFDYGYYIISAYAWPVETETNTVNNIKLGDIIYVGIQGDINGDGIVNMLDAGILVSAFFATPSSRNWNPNVDINGDGVVNILDAIILANHYGLHYP